MQGRGKSESQRVEFNVPAVVTSGFLSNSNDSRHVWCLQLQIPPPVEADDPKEVWAWAPDLQENVGFHSSRMLKC